MFQKTKILGTGATCLKCHRAIAQGSTAWVEGTGFYVHSICYRPGYVFWHGKYVKQDAHNDK